MRVQCRSPRPLSSISIPQGAASSASRPREMNWLFSSARCADATPTGTPPPAAPPFTPPRRRRLRPPRGRRARQEENELHGASDAGEVRGAPEGDHECVRVRFPPLVLSARAAFHRRARSLVARRRVFSRLLATRRRARPVQRRRNDLTRRRSVRSIDRSNLALLTRSVPPLLRARAVSLKADHFEGGRFDFNKQLNQKFFLSPLRLHGLHRGPRARATRSSRSPTRRTSSAPTSSMPTYMLVGRALTDGRLSGRLKYDFSDALSAKLQTSEGARVLAGHGRPRLQGARLARRSSSSATARFYGVNYLQSVSDALSLGGEGFWLGGQKKSGVGFAARYADDKTVATGQVATTGLVSLDVHRPR